MLVEFTARGSLRALASAIEAFAAERRLVSALVVPWESDERTVKMAVTSAKSDGWAIEHTNLGTISLSDLGDDRTRVAVEACHPADAPPPEEARARDKQRAMLVAFARQVEQKFDMASSASVANGAGERS